MGSNSREGVAVCQKPSSGWITCNVDAAVQMENGRSSFGCVLRDATGSYISSYGGSFIGIVDPKIAEAMAFR